MQPRSYITKYDSFRLPTYRMPERWIRKVKTANSPIASWPDLFWSVCLSIRLLLAVIDRMC